MPPSATSPLLQGLQAGAPPSLGRPATAFDLSLLPDAAWHGRTASAAQVIEYCTKPDGALTRSLDGVRIRGHIDLSSRRIGHALKFSNCLFMDTVDFSDADFRQLRFVDCTFAKSISAKNVRCLTLAIKNSLAADRVDLRYAHIAGPLELQDSEFQAQCPESLDISGGIIARDLLMPRTRIHGSFMAPGLRIDGLLDCTDMTAHGAAWVIGAIDVYGEPRRRMDAPNVGLVLDFARIAGWVRMSSSAPGRMSVNGLIRIRSAYIGALNCDGATFTNSDAICLNLERTVVANSVLLRQGFTANGTVRLFAAQIGDALELSGAKITAQNGTAIAANRLQVGGPILLRDRFEANGTCRFDLSTIGSFVDCADGTFNSPNNSVASSASFATRGMAAALSFDRATIGGAISLTDGFVAAGAVSFAFTQVKEGLRIGKMTPSAKAVVISSKDVAIRGAGMTVGQSIHLRTASLSGIVDLRNASCGSLDDDVASWPARLIATTAIDGEFTAGYKYNPILRHPIKNKQVRYSSGIILDGFRYENIRGPDISFKRRILIFEHSIDWNRPQPYLQLAQIYNREGDGRSAKKVNIARLNAYHHPLRPARWVLQPLIGYGYRPFRAGLFLAIIFLLSGYVFGLAAARGDFVPATRTGHVSVSSAKCSTNLYPCFSPYGYSLDSLLPVLSLQQRQFWVVDSRKAPWIRYWSWALDGVGWIVGLVVVAGFSNVVRKE